MSKHFSSTQSRIRAAISCVLAFFIAFFMFLLTCVTILQTTVLNESFVLRYMNRTSYEEKITEEIKQQFISYGSASGVDASHFDRIFQEILPPSQIRSDVEDSVHQVYTNTVKISDFSSLSAELKDSFLQYAQEKGLTVSDDEAVQYLADMCVKSYSDYVSIPYAGQIANLLANYSRPIQFVSFGLIACVFLLGIFILLINRWKHRTVRYYLYAISGAGLMSLVLPIVILLLNKIDKVSLASPALYDFAVAFMHGILNYFFVGAFCLVVLIVLLFLLYLHEWRKVASSR